MYLKSVIKETVLENKDLNLNPHSALHTLCSRASHDFSKASFLLCQENGKKYISLRVVGRLAKRYKTFRLEPGT